jgi:glycosyltransferase involved in cell wall biosynthesis
MKLESDQILALIPAYNEAQRIGQVVSAARNFLPVLVIDDGSSDRTAQTAEKAGAQVLSQSSNQGKGAALRLGLNWALKGAFLAVLTLDADGQHDPAEIPNFLNHFQAHGGDLIIGARDFSHMPLTRRLANNLGAVSFSWAIGRKIPDNQSGFRLIGRRLMVELIKSREGGFEFEVEMIQICIRKGYQLDWIPIRTIYSGESSHIQPLKHIKEFSRLVWETRRNR